MRVKVYTVNSFAKSINGGNPAGVVLNADGLSDVEMKKIAGVVGFSETAFVMKSNLADFMVRFFTPNEEVDFCGHATIAVFHTISSKGYIKSGRYSQETKAGILDVQVMEDLSIMMNQNIPSYHEIIEKQEIADSLNITVDEMLENLPVQIVSTALRDILVPIKSLDILNSINPDFKKVENISSKYNTVGYHIFTLESLNESNAHCRNFAPLYGIPEESATGTSNGALACYLYKYGKLKHDHITNISIEQGYSMERPSEIKIALTTKEKEITEVRVGGIALNLSEIEVEI
ncbi:MAG: PhzF family phenazine biosynthesis protein [Kurthia gibsonii]|uniref:PhzF family phenazine biosynthesis protein n=1 Tax=Kurthia gibsonii TaxID=33946 RepID=UPI000EB18FD9|nr:PhzF family phenazine biosynthesis protein [Kurthia gibsonii]RXH52628.1 PhzF family phenazine biosynthesis protein [Kurthia gibsonii]